MIPMERPPGGRPTKAKILELDAELKKIERELYRVKEQPPAEPVKKKKLWKNRPWAPPLMLD